MSRLATSYFQAQRLLHCVAADVALRKQLVTKNRLSLLIQNFEQQITKVEHLHKRSAEAVLCRNLLAKGMF